MTESLMCDFQFDLIDRNFSNVNLQKTLLWILHADKIPPHIGISVDGLFFSLKVRGKDEFMPTEKLVSLINYRKISSVLIELKLNYEISDVVNQFKHFERAVDLSSSCLVPIKELIVPGKKIDRLKGLLEILKEKELINGVFGLNLAESYAGIPYYTTEQIELRLEKLKHVEG